MEWRVSHGRVQAPGLGRYLWGSALLHFGVAAGLALWWGAGERGSLIPASPPLQVALLQPDAEAERASSDVGPEAPDQPTPEDEPAPSQDVAFAVEHAEPLAAESPVPPQATEAPSAPAPPPTAAADLPRAPSTPRRSTPPPDRRVPRPPRYPAPVRPQPLGTDRDGPASPSAPLPEVAQRPERPSVLTPSPPADTRERRVGPLPLLSDEDLAKYAQVPAGQPRSRPLHGVDTTLSLNTTDVKYLAYFAHLKEKIERQWHYPAEAAARGIEGQLVLLFVLQRSGHVSRVELLRSAGATMLDRAAWEAVLNASPFEPVPPQIPEEPLHIRARFTYLLEESARRTRVQ